MHIIDNAKRRTLTYLSFCSAHRHRHTAVIQYLREKGATTGSANKSTNLITAAAQGDLDEVQLLLATDFDKDRSRKQKLDINKGDYDKRTALHLAYVVNSCNDMCLYDSLPLFSLILVLQRRRGTRANCQGTV